MPEPTNEVKMSNETFETLKVALAFKGHVDIRLISNSMSPLLPTGSVARIEPCTFDDVAKYDMIVFWYHGQLTCHCVWGRGVFPAPDGQRTLVTRGLNNPTSDDPVRESWILGRIVSHKTNAWQFNWNLLRAKLQYPFKKLRSS